MPLTPEQIAAMNQVTGQSKPVTPQATQVKSRADEIRALGAQPDSPSVGGFLKSLVSAPATILARPFQALQTIGNDLGTDRAGAEKDAADIEAGRRSLIKLIQTKKAKGEDTTHLETALHQIVGTPNSSAQELSDQANFKSFSGGVVAPAPNNIGDVKKDVGRAAQTVALGAGPITGGAAFGFGSSLEQGNDVLSPATAVQTILGGLAGKTLDVVGKPIMDLAGKVVGKITPELIQDAAKRGVVAIEEFAAKKNILPGAVSKAINEGVSGAETALNEPFQEAGNSIKNTAKDIINSRQASTVDRLEQDYEKWTGATKPGVKKLGKIEARTAALDAAGTEGRTPQRILAESGIVPETEGTKFRTSDQAKGFREKLAPLQEANQSALKEVAQASEPIKLENVRSRALSNVESRNLPAGDKASLRKDVNSEFDLLKEKYGDNIIITDLNREKQNYWGATKFDSTKPFKNDAYYQIGKASQKTIEETARSAGFEDVAQLNREIGDRLEASKLLEGLDGQTLKFGKLGKYVFSGIGASLGTTIPGKVAGALGGDMVADLLMKNDVSNPVKRLILKNIEAKDPEAYKAALKWIEEQGILRDTRLQLPAGSKGPIVNEGRPIPVFPKEGPQIDAPRMGMAVMPSERVGGSGKAPVDSELMSLQDTAHGLTKGLDYNLSPEEEAVFNKITDKAERARLVKDYMASRGTSK